MDAWVRGEQDLSLISMETYFELAREGSASPKRYEIRSFTPGEPDLRKGETYRATVDLDFETKAGSPIKKEIRYEVSREEGGESWNVVNEMKPLFSRLRPD